MTEFDLHELGIWWIPIAQSAPDRDACINAWAIEDDDLGFTLFDCGLDTAHSIAAIATGLAQAGATLRDVRRIIVSHADPEHAGGICRLSERAGGDVEIFASVFEAGRLRLKLDPDHEIRDGDRFAFRGFTATAVHAPGHSPGLIALHARDARVLFSSDLLVQGRGASEAVALPGGPRAAVDTRAYHGSLHRLLTVDVSVVLPGRGSPFSGHRRVVREVAASIGGRPCKPPAERSTARCPAFEPGAPRAQRD